MIKKNSPAFRTFFLLAAFLSSAFFLSCSKSDGQLKMQELAPQDLSPRISWALVSDPYVACHKEASYESSTIASFRKGEIYEIKGERTLVIDKGEKDEKKELWYALEEGWIPSSAVKVYSNKLKAEQAKKSIK
ncbi:MAG: hypothetical protein IJ257_08030 [Treponema sp.]|nr:hypothetical protein [Treponema sp.]